MNFVIVGSSALAVRAPDTEVAVSPTQASEAATGAADPIAVAGAPGTAPKPDRRGDDRPFQSRDRRWSQRSEIVRQGVVSAEPGDLGHSCKLRDISRFGAMLEFDAGVASELPQSFTLVFFSNRIRSEAQCVLRWHAGNRVGVSFAGPVRTTVARDRG